MKKRFALAGTMALCAGSISAIQVDNRGRDISAPTATERDVMERGGDSGTACCFLDNSGCSDEFSSDTCMDAGGNFYSDETCKTVTCPTYGACCLDWGSDGCEYMREDSCVDSWGGIFHPGVTCEEGICPTVGVCCFYDGECVPDVASPEACYAMPGAKYFAMGYADCEEAKCSEKWPDGCCLDDGSCVMLNEYDCYISGGNFSAKPCDETACYPACEEWPIFDSIARPVINENCGPYHPYNHLFGHGGPDSPSPFRIDLDNDGSAEFIADPYCEFSYSPQQNQIPSKNIARAVRLGDQIGSVKTVRILDLTPTSHGGNMTYEGFDLTGGVLIELVVYFDVTGDGLPDAIVQLCDSVNEWGSFNCDPWNDQQGGDNVLFYIENISTPTTACASDATGDGVVNVDDLIAMIADWGTCPQ